METTPHVPAIPSPPYPVYRPQLPCVTGQAYTCTVACDLGADRTPMERVFNLPGAEVCAVTHCSCEQLPQPQPWLNLPPAESVQDAGLPLAIVIFGFEQLLKR